MSDSQWIQDISQPPCGSSPDKVGDFSSHVLAEYIDCASSVLEQSGTKPNLVAKIMVTKFGFVPDCWGIV